MATKTGHSSGDRKASRTYPFVIAARSVAGVTVREACAGAVALSRHLRCMVEAEINDTKITVCGAVMNEEDAYAQWQYLSKRNVVS